MNTAKQTNLTTASTQWMNRPDDERFFDLDEMQVAASKQQETSTEANVRLANLRFTPVEGVENGIQVEGQAGQRACIGNLGFQQCATRLNYPVSGIIDKVPAKLACDILNHRLKVTVADDVEAEVQALFDEGTEGLTIRSVTSERYSRVYDAEIIPYAKKLVEAGWKVPPGRPNREGGRERIATHADVLRNIGAGGGMSVNVGDPIGPSGLYRGDRDMFIFLVDDKGAVDDGAGNPLYRGMWFGNSEVGVGSFSVTEFLMQGVCGNHIVWGARNIVQIKYRHVGEASERIHEALEKQVLTFQPKPLTNELAVIKWMREHKLGNGVEEVADSVYSFRIPQLTQRTLTRAYNNAAEHREVDGDPDTWYGFANALTRFSQTEGNADDRIAIDVGAGRLFERAAKLVTV